MRTPGFLPSLEIVIDSHINSISKTGLSLTVDIGLKKVDNLTKLHSHRT